MTRSSIDVIEHVLGDRLFPAGWKARSEAEVDPSLAAYRIPAISTSQYRTIQENLRTHWQEVARSFTADPACLLISLRNVSRAHQFSSLAGLSGVDAETVEAMAFQAMVVPQLQADDAAIVRRALLYSETAALNDPTQLLRPPHGNAMPGFGIGEDTPDGVSAWQQSWQSAFIQLGLLHKLVQAGVVTLYPIADLSWNLMTDEQPGGIGQRKRQQIAELQALYRSDRWKGVLAKLPFSGWQEAGVYAGWALGQFAWRNIVLPGATPWLPDAKCVAALAGLEKCLDEQVLGAESLTTGRLSSVVGIDISQVSDEDIIALRSSEDLFATWRRIVAELTLEVDRLAIARKSDLTTLVQARQVQWRAELARRTGDGSVLSGILDANPIVCGLITGGAAWASGLPPGLSAVSALGGGLVTPLMRLLANSASIRGGRARGKSVTAHFMALGA